MHPVTANSGASAVDTSLPPRRSVLQGIARGSSTLYVGAVATLALGLIAKAVLTRALTPTEFGTLVVAQTIASMVQVAGQLGLSDAVVRFVGLYAGEDMGKARAVVIRSLRMAIAGTGLLGLAFGLGSLVLKSYRPAQASQLTVVAILTTVLPFVTTGDLLASGYQGLKRFWIKLICVDWGRGVFLILGVGTLLLLGHKSLIGVASVYVLGFTISGIVLAVYFARDPVWKAATGSIESRRLLAFSAPLVLAGIVNWPASMALPLILAGKVSTQAVAYFNVSLTISNLVYMPAAAVETAAMPAWAGRINDGSRAELAKEYQFTTRWCLLLGLLLLAPLCLCPAEVLSVIYGSQYREAGRVLLCTSPIIAFNAATGPNEGLLRAFGHTQYILVGRLIGGATSLLLAALLASRMGIYGVIAGLGVATVANLCFYSFMLFRSEGVHPFTWPYAKTMLVGLGILGLGSRAPLYPGGGIWRIISVAVLYALTLAVLLLVTKAFTDQDRRMFRRLTGYFSKRTTT